MVTVTDQLQSAVADVTTVQDSLSDSALLAVQQQISILMFIIMLYCLPQAKLGSITDQLQLAEADVTTSHDDKARLIKQLKPVRKQLMAASKARGEAETRAQEYQVSKCD